MNDPRRIVSNTGPLISLEKLTDGYELMRRMYDAILIPHVVVEEVAADQFSTPTAYLRHYGITDLIEVHSEIVAPDLPGLQRLHEGERQAICLALECRLPLLIEETLGREIAALAGIHFSGIAGQIVKAFRADLLSFDETQEKLWELLQVGRINRKIYEQLLESLPRS